jgi:hypothetical protein
MQAGRAQWYFRNCSIVQSKPHSCELNEHDIQMEYQSVYISTKRLGMTSLQAAVKSKRT